MSFVRFPVVRFGFVAVVVPRVLSFEKLDLCVLYVRPSLSKRRAGFFVFSGRVAFRLFGFSAFWLLWPLRGVLWLLWLFISQFLSVCVFFASSALPVSLRQVAFWLCGLWRLYGFGFSHPLLSHLVFWPWLPASSASQVPLWCPRHPPFDFD